MSLSTSTVGVVSTFSVIKMFPVCMVGVDGRCVRVRSVENFIAAVEAPGFSLTFLEPSVLIVCFDVALVSGKIKGISLTLLLLDVNCVEIVDDICSDISKEGSSVPEASVSTSMLLSSTSRTSPVAYSSIKDLMVRISSALLTCLDGTFAVSVDALPLRYLTA